MLIERAQRWLRTRRFAYRAVFQGGTADHQIVLEDLAKFCRAHASTFHPDARIADRLDGRREVWLRIAQHLQLTEEQLWDLYGNKHLHKTE